METENKAVLISIKPKWCELIANGKMTIEVRKTKPKLNPPFKCYIYCTSIKSLNLQEYVDVHKATGGAVDSWSGKVIGEFVCKEIETLHSNAVFNAPALYSLSCMTRDEYFKYSTDHTVYLWDISDPKIYDEPKELSEFGLTRPPQSWCYVEEVK